MELKEDPLHHQKNTLRYKHNKNQYIVGGQRSQFIIRCSELFQNLKYLKRESKNHEDDCHKHVEKEEDEELAVVEADAVVDPGAVVVHVEYASIAG